jgi:hypothetical protein
MSADKDMQNRYALLETIPCDGIGDIVRVVVLFRVVHDEFVVWIETVTFWADREIRHEDNWGGGLCTAAYDNGGSVDWHGQRWNKGRRRLTNLEW